MPTYDFVDRATGASRTEFMWVSELDGFMAEHPELSLSVTGATPTVDPMRMGRKKVDDGFKSVLKRIDKFYKGNTMNL